MKRILLPFLSLLLLASCGGRQQPAAVEGDTLTGLAALKTDTTFVLNDLALLRLCSCGDVTAVELTYGDEVQEFMGAGNTTFVRDDEGRIVLDTVHLDGSLSSQYIVRTADRSSTYGAEVWYVVYPTYEDGGSGPWSLARVPWDLPGLEVVGNDTFLVYYEYGHTGRYSVYAFEAGIFREIPSLRTLK